MMRELYVANCIDFMKKMQNGSVDLTVTSLYDDIRKYNGYVFYFEGIASVLYDVTKEVE